MKRYNFLFFITFFIVVTVKATDSHAKYEVLDRSIDAQFVDIDTNDAKLLRSIVMRFCIISFVKVHGKEYLVKQKRFLYKLLGPAKDALTAHVAETLASLTKEYIAHRVDIIPAGKKFVGKKYAEWPATIHTIAPGMVMRDLRGKCPYSGMKLQQGEIGITREMITSVAQHWQLPFILALDTFLCNHDRHKGNLFYNTRDDSFCAIDMDSSYKYNLAKLSYENFRQMLKKGSFSSKEIKALMQYRDTLQFLRGIFSARDILVLYDRYLEQAGFVNGSDFYTDKLKRLVQGNKTIIVESYPYVEKIILLLNDFLPHGKRA